MSNPSRRQLLIGGAFVGISAIGLPRDFSLSTGDIPGGWVRLGLYVEREKMPAIFDRILAGLSYGVEEIKDGLTLRRAVLEQQKKAIDYGLTLLVDPITSRVTEREVANMQEEIAYRQGIIDEAKSKGEIESASAGPYVEIPDLVSEPGARVYLRPAYFGNMETGDIVCGDIYRVVYADGSTHETNGLATLKKLAEATV